MGNAGVAGRVIVAGGYHRGRGIATASRLVFGWGVLPFARSLVSRDCRWFYCVGVAHRLSVP